ncbi:unnamed protein product, partial [Prorocentrum cordatum]
MTAAVQIPLHANVAFHDTKICWESLQGSPEEPIFNIALNVKISAADIAKALISFQESSEKISASPAFPASQGALGKPPPPATSTRGLADAAAGTPAAPAPAAKKAPPPGGAQAKAPAPAARAAPAEPERPLPKATWDSPPHLQQEGHRDYVDKTKWKADEGSWKLLDDCLLKFVPTRLEPPPRRRRIPQDRPPIEERPPAPAAPRADSDLPGPPAAAPPPDAKLHGPPPAGPPPPQPSRTAADTPSGLSGTGGTGGPDGDPGEPGGQKDLGGMQAAVTASCPAPCGRPAGGGGGGHPSPLSADAGPFPEGLLGFAFTEHS